MSVLKTTQASFQSFWRECDGSWGSTLLQQEHDYVFYANVMTHGRDFRICGA